MFRDMLKERLSVVLLQRAPPTHLKNISETQKRKVSYFIS